MSTPNGTVKNKDTYLQHVSLKNYKSIKDLEIDFEPGLNIIIGKNASGKTNFINGLNTILNFNYSELLDSDIGIEFAINNEKIEIQAIDADKAKKRVVDINSYYGFSFDHDIIFKLNGKRLKIDKYQEIINYLLGRKYFFNDVLIKYGIYYKENSAFVNLPFSFTLINNGRVSREMMSNAIESNTEFTQRYFNRLYTHLIGTYYPENSTYVANKVEIKANELKEKIILYSEIILKNINDIILRYSPINAIRINPDFNIVNEDANNKQSVTNLYIEFLIDGNWLTYNLLSDGTKRLFYIISEILATIYFYERNNDDAKHLAIILLEEPELGIHPHQLHQLMQFIKEQAREKQIILTTHSPQVLDVLGPDELDRIIICHSDPKNGTKLSHLTEKEMAKARKYMKEEAFLSDYWRFSDLEPAS